MASVDTSPFAEAHKREHELNARQREILDLLVAAKTNGEIAQSLGMTLDGAKWNVSEILTKLGLATREEAAEYWRWRRGLRMRSAALLGRMAGATPFKWFVGAGAAAGVVAVAALLVVSIQPDDPLAEGSFYLEASIEVIDRSRSVGTNADGSSSPDLEETTSTTMRWWQQDRDRARIEMSTEEPTGTEFTTIVMDGEHQWVHQANSNTYSKTLLPPLPDGVPSRFPSFSILLGPAPVTTREALVEQLKEWAAGSVYERGTATVLGMDCELLIFGPASTSSTGSSGEIELCLHVPTMMILRYVVTDNIRDVHAEVTHYDAGAQVDASKLTFRPPPGAIERADIDSYTVSGSSSTGGRTPPPGFFAITYLPSGFDSHSEEVTSSSSGITGHLVRFERESASLVIAQSLAAQGIGNRPGGARSVDINGNEAWYLESAGPAGSPHITVVTWRSGIRIQLRAEGVELSEVLNVAAGLELQ